MSAAESLPAVQSVEFNGDRLATFEKDGERWVAMRPVVEGMGIAWTSQYAKLSANPSRYGMRDDIITHDAMGRRQREMTCIPLRRYPMWLATINPAKIFDPTVRPECGNGSMGVTDASDDRARVRERDC